MPENMAESAVMVAANGNVKTRTVAIVVLALVLFGGVLMTFFGLHTKLTAEDRVLDRRVTRLEAQYENIDEKLDRVIDAVGKGN